jgi:hypothetical protein
MIQLIATPEKFDGKTISVVGFLAVEPEDARLYLRLRETSKRSIYTTSRLAVFSKKEVCRFISLVAGAMVESPILVGALRLSS